MKPSKSKISWAVNTVMAEMFYLSPDLDELGRQKIDGPAPAEGTLILLPISDSYTLQLIYEWRLLQLMTANLTALPADELPKDWIRQIATESTSVIWGKFLTEFDKNSEYDMFSLQPTDQRMDITGAEWHFTFTAESHRLTINLIKQANL